MIAMSFAQTAIVNGNPNPKAIFGDWSDGPAGDRADRWSGSPAASSPASINGSLIAYTKIPPFIATLGMMVSARGVARWWSNGNPISFPTESYADLANGDLIGTLTFGLLHWRGQNPVIVFVVLAILFHLIMRYTLYGKRCYAIGSNEAAARMSGINVARPQGAGLHDRRHARRGRRAPADLEEPDRAGGHGRDVRARRHRHGGHRRRVARPAAAARSSAR